mgnify:CR=1 FL=1
MRLSPIQKVAIVFALMFAFDATMILYAIADNGQQPPRPNVAEARIAALERQVAQQDQTLVLMQLMLGQLRQDLEEVRKELGVEEGLPTRVDIRPVEHRFSLVVENVVHLGCELHELGE